MPQFDAGRGFQRRLNVRDFGYLLHLLEEKARTPTACSGRLLPPSARARPGHSSSSGTTLAGHGHCTSTSAAECQISGEAEV